MKEKHIHKWVKVKQEYHFELFTNRKIFENRLNVQIEACKHCGLVRMMIPKEKLVILV